jgi:drug/metabolite transporter (DMT)-like permease
MPTNGTTMRGRQLRADLVLLFVAFIWGTTFTLIKEALEEGPPWFFLALRFLAAALVLLPFVVRGRSWPLRDGLILGVILSAGYLSQTVGLQTIEPGRSAFITGMSVVFVPLIGRLFGWDRLTRLDGLGAGLAWIGLALLTGWALDPGGPLRVGDLWTLACAVAFALHILWIGRFTGRHPAFRLAWIQIAFAALFMAGGTAIFERDAFSASSPTVATGGAGGLLGLSPIYLGAAAFTGVLATALAFVLQVRMQRETTATHTAIVFAAEPVFAALVSLVVRNELPGAWEVVGGALILGGILAIQYGTARRELTP